VQVHQVTVKNEGPLFVELPIILNWLRKSYFRALPGCYQPLSNRFNEMLHK